MAEKAQSEQTSIAELIFEATQEAFATYSSFGERVDAKILGDQLWSETNSTSRQLQFPAEIPKYYTSIRIRQYYRENLFDVGATNQVGTMFLPLPQNVIDVHQVDYRESATGMVGGLYTAGKTGFGSGGGPQGEVINDRAAQIGEAIGYGGLGGLRLPQKIVNATGLSQSDWTGAIESLYGIAQNEFVVILLKGPKYKKHSLKWKLSPRTFDEATSLRQIIHIINKSMAVETVAGGFLWDFPYIFDIAYLPNPGYLMKFKPMVIETFAVNYSPNGSPGFYRDPGSDPGVGIEGSNNSAECVDIEMRLIELEYWLRRNFKDNNDPYSGHNRR